MEPLELLWKLRISSTISKVSQQSSQRENYGASKATTSTQVPILIWPHWELQAYQNHLFNRDIVGHSHQLDRCPTTVHLVGIMRREWPHLKAIINWHQYKVACKHMNEEVVKRLDHINEKLLLMEAHLTYLKMSSIIKTAIPTLMVFLPWQGTLTLLLCQRKIMKIRLLQVYRVSRLSSHQIWRSCEPQIIHNHLALGCHCKKV